MTESITFAENLGSQASALILIASLAEKSPELPPAYIVFSWAEPYRVHVQLDNLKDIEAWREALHVASTAMALEAFGKDRRQLTFEAVVNDVRVDVWVPFSDTQSENQPEGATA